MKKLITITLGLILATGAMAQHQNHYPVQHSRHDRAGNLLVPLIIGGVLSAAIINSQQQQQQPAVVYVPQPVQPAVVYAPPVLQQRMPTIQCPAGSTDFWTREIDRSGNPYFMFAGCR